MSYLIRERSPLRRAVNGLLVLAGLAVFGYAAFIVGAEFRNGGERASIEESRALQQRVTTLESQNTELLKRVARLQRFKEVDVRAASAVQQTLNEMETRMSELNDELLLYKSIVAPSQMEPGLHVQNFRVATGKVAGEYQYKLVLTQVRGDNQVAQGAVDLYIECYKGDKSVRFSLAELSSNSKDRIFFKFKYFQSVEGSMAIPAGFTPAEVEVRVLPSSDWLEAVNRTFEWDASLVGGT